MRFLCSAMLLVFVFSFSVSAGDLHPAEEILKSKLEAALAVLKKKDVDEQTKKKEITEIVAPIFDFPLMAKLALGKKYWSALSPEKKEKYTHTFERFIKLSYLEKMLLYTDEKIAYQPAIQRKNKVHVPTELMGKDKKYSMLYKFYKAKSEWKIYDVEVQGVSLIVTYRSQFDSILQTESFDDLLAKMENREISKSESPSD